MSKNSLTSVKENSSMEGESKEEPVIPLEEEVKPPSKRQLIKQSLHDRFRDAFDTRYQWELVT
jgi:hypothetical protein